MFDSFFEPVLSFSKLIPMGNRTGMPNLLIEYTPEILTLLATGQIPGTEKWNQKHFEDNIGKAYSYFPELNEQKIKMIFSHRSTGIVDGALATTFPLRYPNSGVDEFKDIVSIHQTNIDLDFVIIFARNIFEREEIAQTINFSHEYQHAFQYINDKKTYFFGCIEKYLLRDKISLIKTPIEYDAERKSKIVIYEIYGKDQIYEWVESSAKKIKHEFFEVFKDINVDVGYDLTKEVLRIWKENKIEEKIFRLRNKKNPTEDDLEILKLYDFALKENIGIDKFKV